MIQSIVNVVKAESIEEVEELINSKIEERSKQDFHLFDVKITQSFDGIIALMMFEWIEDEEE